MDGSDTRTCGRGIHTACSTLEYFITQVLKETHTPNAQDSDVYIITDKSLDINQNIAVSIAYANTALTRGRSKGSNTSRTSWVDCPC